MAEEFSLHRPGEINSAIVCLWLPITAKCHRDVKCVHLTITRPNFKFRPCSFLCSDIFRENSHSFTCFSCISLAIPCPSLLTLFLLRKPTQSLLPQGPCSQGRGILCAFCWPAIRVMHSLLQSHGELLLGKQHVCFSIHPRAPCWRDPASLASLSPRPPCYCLPSPRTISERPWGASSVDIVTHSQLTPPAPPDTPFMLYLVIFELPHTCKARFPN